MVDTVVNDADIITPRLPLPIDPFLIRAINCFNGNLKDAFGRADWWAIADDVAAVAKLESVLTRLDRMGWRRFLLILPAGHPHGRRYMSSSQWGPMPERRRDALMSMLPRWKADHPDTAIYVYAGFNIGDPTNLYMPQLRSELVVPDITRDWSWFQANWRQWIEDCHIDGIGFDFAGAGMNRASFIRVARVLSVAGIRCIGEAVPTKTRLWSRRIYPAPEAYQGPWYILENYLERIDPRRKWRFGPETDISVAFRHTKTVVELREFLARGFKLINYSSSNDDAMMEVQRTLLATDADAGDAG